MYVLGNFLAGLAQVLNLALQLYLWIIIARAVLSWVNPDPYNPIVRFLNRVTDPPLYWLRRRVPLTFGGFDLSPLVLILAIIFLQSFLVRSLAQFAARISH